MYTEKSKLKYIVIMLLSGFVSLKLFAQEVKKDTLSEIELTKRMSILKDRFYIYCPDSTKIIVKPRSKMGIADSGEKETTMVYENGEKRLIILAVEMESFGSDNLLEEVSKYYSHKKFEKLELVHSEFNLDDPLKIIQSIPQKHNPKDHSVLINNIIIKSPDNSLVKIGAYVSHPNSTDEIDSYTLLSNKIFKTIQIGSRELLLSEREEKHPILGLEEVLCFDIPNNHLLQIDHGYSFDVFNLIPIRPLNDSIHSVASVYVGKHPSWFYGAYGSIKNEYYTMRGAFLGKKITWYYVKNREQKKYLIEYEYHAKKIEKGLIIHIIMESNNENEVKKLKDVIEKIQLEN